MFCLSFSFLIIITKSAKNHVQKIIDRSVRLASYRTEMRERSHVNLYEPQHDKTNKVAFGPAKTLISLGIRPVASESSLSA